VRNVQIIIKQEHIESFIRDPVLAAWHFFGAELDVHQRVRLRMMWFVKEYHDDSGIYTGKTIVGWLWAQLRCILLPSPRGFDPRIVGVFYQDISSANSIYKPYYEKFISSSPRFRSELARHKGGKLGFRRVGGGFEYVYRNGNSNFIPAIGLKEDAEKIASLRVHDGIVEEAKSIEKKSDALDNQILSRINADCWNPNHPVWTNHKVLMGHAEDPATHPSYKRHKAAKAAIWDGDQETAILTSNFRDWTPAHAHRRKDKEIKMAKRTMSPAKFAQRYGGFWEYGTEDWYEPKVLSKCQSRHAMLLSYRDCQEAIFCLGQDTAGGGSRRSDWNAMVLWRALRVPDWKPVPDTTGLYIASGDKWEISPVWAWQGKSRDGGQLSGIVHRGHQRFQFGRVVYDPGGGGLWVAKEYWKKQQFFDGRVHQVTGLCKPEDSGIYPEAMPIMIPWGKGSSDLAHAWQEPRFLSSDDGIVEAIHLKAQEMFYGQQLRWPMSPDDWGKKELQALGEEERRSLMFLNMTLQQLVSIKTKMTTKNGEEVPVVTKQGFRSFTATGKKDLAYAALYGLAGILSLIHDPELADRDSADPSCMAMG
jgi:hypothetical protein